MILRAGQWVKLISPLCFHGECEPRLPAGAIGCAIGLVPGTIDVDLYEAEYAYRIRFGEKIYAIRAYELELISVLEAMAEVARDSKDHGSSGG